MPSVFETKSSAPSSRPRLKRMSIFTRFVDVRFGRRGQPASSWRRRSLFHSNIITFRIFDGSIQLQHELFCSIGVETFLALLPRVCQRQRSSSAKARSRNPSGPQRREDRQRRSHCRRERIASKTVIWTAGVMASLAGKWLGAQTDRAGRVRVQPDLSVPVTRKFLWSRYPRWISGKPLGGVAQVAMQQGHYAGKLIRRHVAGKKARPVSLFRQGNMAVVGKGYAILESGKFTYMVFSRGWHGLSFTHFIWLNSVKGSACSCMGLVILTGQRGSRLIVNYQQSDRHKQRRQSSHADQGAQPARLETTLTSDETVRGRNKS